MATAEHTSTNAYVRDTQLVLAAPGANYAKNANTAQIGSTGIYNGFGIVPTDVDRRYVVGNSTVIDVGQARIDAQLCVDIQALDTDAGESGRIDVFLYGYTEADPNLQLPFTLWQYTPLNPGAGVNDLNLSAFPVTNIKFLEGVPTICKWLQLGLRLTAVGDAAPTITFRDVYLTLANR